MRGIVAILKPGGTVPQNRRRAYTSTFRRLLKIGISSRGVKGNILARRSFQGDPRLGDKNLVVGRKTMPVLKKSKAVKVMERRTDTRVPCLFATQAILLPDRKKIDIECINVSRGGLAFRSRAAFKTGDRIAVRMQYCNRDGQGLLCEVRHCDEDAEGYRVGVQVVERITARQGRFEIPQRWRHG
jgi:hypothetical protein